MISLSCRAFVIACMAGIAGFSTQAQSQDYYKGKQIKLILGSGEGSGVDILGRIAARHLPKHIPGNPVIVPQNMPAPESIAVANHIYNIAAPVVRGLLVVGHLQRHSDYLDADRFSLSNI